jgi:hypothetical protein
MSRRVSSIAFMGDVSTAPEKWLRMSTEKAMEGICIYMKRLMKTMETGTLQFGGSGNVQLNLQQSRF